MVTDPILGRSLDFYLFTLPVWNDLAGWLLALAILFCIAAVFSALIAGGRRLSHDAYDRLAPFPWRMLSVPVAFLLLVLAVREYIARIELMLTPHTVFSGDYLYGRARAAGRNDADCDCAGAGRDCGGVQFCGAAAE